MGNITQKKDMHLHVRGIDGIYNNVYENHFFHLNCPLNSCKASFLCCLGLASLSNQTTFAQSNEKLDESS